MTSGTSPETGSTEPTGVPAERHHLVQAPIIPLDQDGVVVAVAGTVGWSVATVVLWVVRGALDRAGHWWWPWVGVAGVVLGLFGIWHTQRRKARRG